eukprot:3086242-Rhodomonas_salina.2
MQIAVRLKAAAVTQPPKHVQAAIPEIHRVVTARQWTCPGRIRHYCPHVSCGVVPVQRVLLAVAVV